MFCPHCGAQVPDGAKFCASCGQPIAAPAETPASSSQGATSGAAAAIARKMPSPKVLGIIGAVVAVLIVGLATNWFGIAKPKLPTGTYSLSMDDGSGNMTLSLAKGGSTMVIPGAGSLTFSSDDPEGSKDGCVYGIISTGSESTGSEYGDYDFTGYYEIPQNPKNSIAGNWVMVQAYTGDEADYSYALVAQVKNDGTFSVWNRSLSTSDDVAKFYESMKDGSLQYSQGEDYEVISGTWTKNDDGTYTFVASDYYSNSATLSISD